MNTAYENQSYATMRQCKEYVNSRNKTQSTVFAGVTALELYGIAFPKADTSTKRENIHIQVSQASNRRKSETAVQHVWQHNTALTALASNMYVVDVVTAWAQLGQHSALPALVATAENILHICNSKTAQQTVIKCPLVNKYTMYQQIKNMPKFKGKAKCLLALGMVRENVYSVQETYTRLCLISHGLPEPRTNVVVANHIFNSGAPATLDLVWERQQVAIEYDGDHHRTDKEQWRRDKNKREVLQSRGWIIYSATANDLMNARTRSQLAFLVGRYLMERGAQFDFTILAQPLEKFAKNELRNFEQQIAAYEAKREGI